MYVNILYIKFPSILKIYFSNFYSKSFFCLFTLIFWILSNTLKSLREKCETNLLLHLETIISCLKQIYLNFIIYYHHINTIIFFIKFIYINKIYI